MTIIVLYSTIIVVIIVLYNYCTVQ